MQKKNVATKFENHKHLLLAILVSAAVMIGIFNASIARASEPRPIIVADLVGDLQRALEKSARDAVNNSGGTRRVEQPVANQPAPSNQQSEKTTSTLPQTSKAKKQVKGAGSGHALPDLPFIERDKSHDLNTGKWRLKRPYPLYAKEGDTTPIKTLAAGTKLEGLSIAAHTLSYEVVEIGNPRTIQLGTDKFTKQGRETVSIPLQRGDKIVTLSYQGEGECRMWLKGRVYVGDCSGNEPDVPTDRRSGAMKTDHWVLVRTPDGLKGWLWQKGDKIYESIQGISRHDEPVK